MNAAAGAIDVRKSRAIAAVQQLADGEHQDALVAPAIQGSAGTSVNMNVNEVVANLASAELKTIRVHQMMMLIRASRPMILIQQPERWQHYRHCHR